MSNTDNPGRIGIWILAARPKTLWAGIVPVVVGGVVAYDTSAFHLLPFLMALAGSILIQIGTNFANDYFDYRKNVDDSDRVGPLRVTQAGLVSPKTMKAATALVFFAAFMIGVYLVYRGGWPVVIIGLSSILFGILYTGGPFPLGYHGLGDIFVIIFYGPVALCGTYYVITLDFNYSVFLASIPPGMMSTAILTVNNLRDYDTDKRTGKHTLAVRFGRTFARTEYAGMVVGAMLFPIFMYLIDGKHFYSMITVLGLIPSVFVIRTVLTQTSGEILNRSLADTGKLLALYGLLFSIGWLI